MGSRFCNLRNGCETSCYYLTFRMVGKFFCNSTCQVERAAKPCLRFTSHWFADKLVALRLSSSPLLMQRKGSACQGVASTLRSCTTSEDGLAKTGGELENKTGVLHIIFIPKRGFGNERQLFLVNFFKVDIQTAI